MLRVTVRLPGGPFNSHCCAFVAAGHNMFCFGDLRFMSWVRTDKDQMDVNVFNTVSLRWRTFLPVMTEKGERPPEVPFNFYNHTAVLVEDVVYIWGGINGSFSESQDVLYAFNVDTHRWSRPEVSGTVPKKRSCHSACVLDKVMYIHGGIERFWGASALNDISKLDISTMVWSTINPRGTLPPGSESHSATIIGTKMFVLGGGLEHRNVIVFDTETNSWLMTPSSQRCPENLLLPYAFAYKGELYTLNANGVWKFNPETSWKKVKLKGEYGGRHDRCCCLMGDLVIIFGELDNKPSDLCILDLSPSLKTLCKLAAIQFCLEQSQLPHEIRWELAAMIANQTSGRNSTSS